MARAAMARHRFTSRAASQVSHASRSGMVFIGEYSSACICEVGPPPAPGAPTATKGGGAAVAGATAGVVMQMRRNAQTNNNGY
jgi:hypothetical protein